MKILERRIFPALNRALADQRIIVITGMRRVGKTTTLRWLLEQVNSNNKIFIDLERLDQRAVFSEKNYELVVQYFRNLGLNPDQTLTVALDEIQYAPNLPSVVKYLFDHYGIKFILTGSSSFYLKNYFSESMSGRKVVYEMFPLGFGEFLDFRGISYRQRNLMEYMRYDPHEYDRLKHFYEEYLAYGGLPNVVLEPNPQVKQEILQEIFSSYINMDVRTLVDFRKMGELQQLLRLLAMRIGNKIDLTKLGQIVGISRPTLNEYLEFLEKTYIIRRLPAYAGPDKAAVLGKKLYFRDNGIANVLANPGEGALFENAIFNQLREYGELAYLSKGTEYEVDFILTTPHAGTRALEVKYHPTRVDEQRIKRIVAKKGISESWIIGKYPTPGFKDFIWGGLIF